MAFNLSTFRSKVHSIGRNQYFLIRIPQIGDSETVTAMARETEMPAMSHDENTVAYRGLNMNVVSKPTFTDWTVKFLCDEAHGFRNVLLKWMEKAYSIQTLSNEAHNDYKRDGASVSQLSSKLEVTSTATFYGFYPKSVGSISLNQEGGQLETFDVTFKYDYFVMNDLQGDVVFNETDIAVSDDGRFEGVTINGVAGVRLRF
jgi:hypothetical protein